MILRLGRAQIFPLSNNMYDVGGEDDDDDDDDDDSYRIVRKEVG